MVYGPTNRNFAVGTGAAEDKTALLNLLEVTNAIINKLYVENKLHRRMKRPKPLVPVGVYDTRADGGQDDDDVPTVDEVD